MSLPILPKAFASVTDFGQLISVYRTECPNRWPAVRRWAMTLVVLAVIGGLCYLTQSEMRRRGFETLSVAGVLLGYTELIIQVRENVAKNQPLPGIPI